MMMRNSEQEGARIHYFLEYAKSRGLLDKPAIDLGFSPNLDQMFIKSSKELTVNWSTVKETIPVSSYWVAVQGES
jgi:hypothetical protein